MPAPPPTTICSHTSSPSWQMQVPLCQWLLLARGELWPLGRKQRPQLPQQSTEEPLLSLWQGTTSSDTGCTHRPPLLHPAEPCPTVKGAETPRDPQHRLVLHQPLRLGLSPRPAGPQPQGHPPSPSGKGAEQQGSCNTLLGIWLMQHRIDLALMWKSLSPSFSP